MIDTKRIRQAVLSKLACLKTVDEETIHTLYQKAIFAECERAVAMLRDLSTTAGHIEASISKDRWVMIERARLQDVIHQLEVIANETSATTVSVRFAPVWQENKGAGT